FARIALQSSGGEGLGITLLFPERALQTGEKVFTQFGASFWIVKLMALLRHEFTQETQPLVDGHSFWGRQRPDQVVNPRIDKLVESFLRLPPPGELLRRHARLLCKRRAEEQEVDHRVFIAAPQTRSDRSVLRFHPFGPTAGALLRRFALQFGGENFIERLQRWSRLFIG